MKQVHYVISKDNEYLVILPKFNNIAPPCEYDFNPSKNHALIFDCLKEAIDKYNNVKLLYPDLMKNAKIHVIIEIEEECEIKL